MRDEEGDEPKLSTDYSSLITHHQITDYPLLTTHLNGRFPEPNEYRQKDHSH
jgi:hypothetical protein